MAFSLTHGSDLSQASLTMRQPDDWHVHFRDFEMAASVVPYTARQFGRALIMPNLKIPLTTTTFIGEYHEKILKVLADHGITDFEPMMTGYLTDHTEPDEIDRAIDSGFVHAFKLYPAHSTTGSAHGVTSIKAIMPVLRRMERRGMPLCIHGESTDPEVDIFDREVVFIDRMLLSLRRYLPGLKIVLEHVTTEEAVNYVMSVYEDGQTNLAATITAHHLIINRNAIFAGGIRPHLYCLPIAKREKHRLMLRHAATSGLPCFFLGTDSAPHAIPTKETACGCAGIFTAPCALELYVQMFEEESALDDRFEKFASLNGAAFYGLPPNERHITLVREPWEVPEKVGIGRGSWSSVPKVQVFHGGETLNWRLAA